MRWPLPVPSISFIILWKWEFRGFRGVVSEKGILFTGREWRSNRRKTRGNGTEL